MIRFAYMTFEGNLYPVFIEDTETGYNGQDVLTKPGIYDEVCNDNLSLPIVEMSGTIGGYSTKMMCLISYQDINSPGAKELEDITPKIQQLLTVPVTAARMLMSRYSEDEREMLETALSTIHFYETVTQETKVFLPKSAFSFMDEDVAKKMQSTRHVYVLKNTDNQEIFQKTCTSEYGVVLPPVDDLHGETAVSPEALDILRVIAPLRREVQEGVFQYQGIYHTPYFKVDPKLRGAVPSYLQHINGYAKNDTLPIQNNERHMYDNLRTFIRSDTARYVAEICTGIFLTHTQLGQNLRRLIDCKNAELLGPLTVDIGASVPEGVTCGVTYTDVQNIITDNGSDDIRGRIAKLVKGSLHLSVDYMREMVVETAKTMRVVNIESLPFVLELSDEDKEALTTCLIENSTISRAVFEYVLQMCCKAYVVNWGHTGAARAIPRFVTKPGIKAMDEVLSAYIGSKVGKAAIPGDVDMSLLYMDTSRPGDDDDDDEVQSEISTVFDYYITEYTAKMIESEQLDPEFFVSAPAVESSEAGLVEYWRRVNGNNNIHHFISNAFMQTGDINVIIECFIKLMRWGDVKPALLVIDQYPEIRTVFDLNVGKEIPNTAIVDESQLVKVNGCSHTIAGTLYSTDIIEGTNALVGLLLCRDYGVKKYVIASLADIGEMVSTGDIDVAELKAVSNVELVGDTAFDVTAMQSGGHQLFKSAKNIELGIKYSVPPEQLNELALLVQPGVLRSVEYLKSKQNTMVVTTKDRQYQILSMYVNVIKDLYKRESELLSKESISTVDLSAIANTVYEMCKGGGQAPDVNDVRAQNVISTMNLDIGAPDIYIDDELVGKFTIISDTEMASAIPPIEFSDASMRKLSQRLRDRIVLLLLETDDKFIICRKDITQSELLIIDHKIEHKKYVMFEKAIAGLKQGKVLKISNSKTSGEKKPTYLHRSVYQYI